MRPLAVQHDHFLILEHTRRKSFWLEVPNLKSHAMTSSEIFERDFLWDKDIVQNGRLETGAWVGT